MWQRYLEYIKKNPQKFKEMKSLKLFSQRFGGVAGAYIFMEEYASLAEYEKLFGRLMFKDEGFMKIYQEFMPLIDPATYSENMWNFVM